MLQELLKIFRPGNTLSVIADEFSKMLGLSCEMTATAGSIYFRGAPSARSANPALREGC